LRPARCYPRAPLSRSTSIRRTRRVADAVHPSAASPGAAPATRNVCLVSLGCSKALVDSEVMVGHLGRAGMTLVTDPADSDVVIVNTCGFIDEARQESLAAIREQVALKRAGRVRGVVVTGCLVELHSAGLSKELPEVDAWLPLSDYSGVPSIVDAVLGGAPSAVCPTGEVRAHAAGVAGAAATATARPGGLVKQADSDLGRALLTSPHTAYLRLGEGCNHVCAFCAIPKIRGKLKSKPLAVLVEEAGALAALGARELTLIAEDSTDYGKDLRAGYGLSELLVELGRLESAGLRWVRVMYAHPATIDERLIDTLAAVGNVAPYLDMPVQHGDDAVLRAMRRGTDGRRIREVVARLRAAIPGLTLRTTILVGFPGETEAGFARLMELLEELRFDRVGCFVFSPEASTEAGTMEPRVPRELAEQRRATVMDLQRRLLSAANRRRIGTHDEVLVDAVERGRGGVALRAVGRTVRDAPEVDGRVLVELGATAPKLAAGEFRAVRITGQSGYDLLAAPA
ncbi:MAG TPA: 30S ribosomal protein S12 methylthiotransferase RimO, partial [Planctomycetota bacterium]|nr:30S ribosomal protein S12 methylthiotransferase RimO [Planctomycetota bacterium]